MVIWTNCNGIGCCQHCGGITHLQWCTEAQAETARAGHRQPFAFHYLCTSCAEHRGYFGDPAAAETRAY